MERGRERGRGPPYAHLSREALLAVSWSLTLPLWAPASVCNLDKVPALDKGPKRDSYTEASLRWLLGRWAYRKRGTAMVIVRFGWCLAPGGIAIVKSSHSRIYKKGWLKSEIQSSLRLIGPNRCSCSWPCY